MSKEVKIAICIVTVVFLFFLALIIGYGIKLDKEKEQREQQILAENRIKQQRLEQAKLSDPKYIEQLRLAEEQRLEQERLAEEQGLELERLAEQKRLEQIREEKIAKQFSLWDGSHKELVRLVKNDLNDAGSFEHIETTYRINKDHTPGQDILFIKMDFRAKNAFGGVIKKSGLFI